MNLDTGGVPRMNRLAMFTQFAKDNAPLIIIQEHMFILRAACDVQTQSCSANILYTAKLEQFYSHITAQ